MTDDRHANPDAPDPDPAQPDAVEASAPGDDGSDEADTIPEAEPVAPEPTMAPSAEADPAPPVVTRAGGLAAIPLSAPAITLTALVTALFLMFLLIEPTPRWLALFGSAVVALSVDGVLRSARREPFEAGVDTTPYLFLPALFVLATPVFLEHNVRGYWALPAALAAGVTFGAVVAAQVASVREFDPARGTARFVAVAAAYFVAFALYSLSYRFELDVSPAMAAAALVSALLAVEILREGEVDLLETLVFAAVTALIVAEVRWTLHFLPLDRHLAALTLLLAFYFVTGLLHSHLTRHSHGQLSALVAAEYVAIAAAGVALVAGARAAGLA